MQLHTAIYLSILPALLPGTLANFDVYADHYRGWSNTFRQPPGFRIFGRTPSDACKYVNNKTYIRWPARPDVSDEKFGIRCSGPGCTYDAANPAAITTFEMHFANTPAYHWTLYADNQGYAPPSTNARGLWMMPAEVGTRAPGYCFPYPGDEYDCERSRPEGPGGETFVVGSRGRRLFRCVTYNGEVESDDINGLRLQGGDMYYPYPDDDGEKSAGEGGVALGES
ncbi:hypothetical protein P171DRAFT_478745 [Karstenula rhodostoma CBS 690.94]|uniref:Uncharacterized protein n=1 Tax=Karstenula rhodostoma CBS 690.94 TaxID=1392251 RepID=A0A9P4UJV3_9PLEO|nr:hypothetical protein P171DRAFT_478745 [Karstenula rhodostoma CBS 690.94]